MFDRCYKSNVYSLVHNFQHLTIFLSQKVIISPSKSVCVCVRGGGEWGYYVQTTPSFYSKVFYTPLPRIHASGSVASVKVNWFVGQLTGMGSPPDHNVKFEGHRVIER